MGGRRRRRCGGLDVDDGDLSGDIFADALGGDLSDLACGGGPDGGGGAGLEEEEEAI